MRWYRALRISKVRNLGERSRSRSWSGNRKLRGSLGLQVLRRAVVEKRRLDLGDIWRMMKELLLVVLVLLLLLVLVVSYGCADSSDRCVG